MTGVDWKSRENVFAENFMKKSQDTHPRRLFFWNNFCVSYIFLHYLERALATGGGWKSQEKGLLLMSHKTYWVPSTFPRASAQLFFVLGEIPSSIISIAIFTP